MRKLLLTIMGLALFNTSALAEELNGLWSYGLTSKRTGEPLIEQGGQHRIDPSVVRYGYNIVVDRKGNTLRPSGAPLKGGEQLRLTENYQADHNMREYARVVSIMAPIRDAILYDFETIDEQEWRKLTEALSLNGIKTSDAPRISDRRAILSTNQVWEYVSTKPKEGSPVMRYLEEAGLELKCLAFKSFDFTNPEGANHCKEMNLPQGAGLVLGAG